MAVDRKSLLPRIWPLSRRFCAMSVSGHTNLEACSPKSCVSGVSRWSLDVLPSRHPRATLATGGSSHSGQCVYSLPGLLLARLVSLRWPRLPPHDEHQGELGRVSTTGEAEGQGEREGKVPT